jgi:hypothetical protein
VGETPWRFKSSHPHFSSEQGTSEVSALGSPALLHVRRVVMTDLEPAKKLIQIADSPDPKRACAEQAADLLIAATSRTRR